VARGHMRAADAAAAAGLGRPRPTPATSQRSQPSRSGQAGRLACAKCARAGSAPAMSVIFCGASPVAVAEGGRPGLLPGGWASAGAASAARHSAAVAAARLAACILLPAILLPVEIQKWTTKWMVCGLRCHGAAVGAPMHGIATYPGAQLPCSHAAANCLVCCCNGYHNARTQWTQWTQWTTAGH